MVMAERSCTDITVMQCGAKTKHGGTCKTPPVRGSKRCRMHGGHAPSGLALPQTKHGRYSKHLPARLAERYQEAATDPELLSQREDIALLDARLADVLDSVSNQESGELWHNLHDAAQLYRKHAGTSQEAVAKRSEALEAILYLIGEGYTEQQSWREIRSILRERKVLVESERKRLIDMQQMITATQANLLLGAVAHIIKSNVTDKTALANISRELGQLVNAGS